MARARLFAGSPVHLGREASLVAILLLLVIGIALAPTLGAGFVFDDRADVLDNPAASPGGLLPALGRTNRPLVKASYALQRLATGESPRPFHAVNLGLHLLTALLVLAFARRLAARAELARPDLVGALAAALWALHPAVVETVAPVTGRSLLLATPLMLAALLLVTGEAPPSRSASLAALGLALAATAARETALVLPALGLAWQATLGTGEDRLTALRRQLPLLAGALLGAAALALSARHRELLAYSFETRSPLEALRGNLFAIPEILRMAVEPGRISIDPATPPDLPWAAPATQLRLAVLVGAGAFGWLLRRRAP
ncbi:MAG TPA: hypothetical protein VLA66_14135, partial [Thermoanaerobaculia bacterium]|nr:hypothetical protein [Thermoanaerobaculia bacterium]